MYSCVKGVNDREYYYRDYKSGGRKSIDYETAERRGIRGNVECVPSKNFEHQQALQAVSKYRSIINTLNQRIILL